MVVQQGQHAVEGALAAQEEQPVLGGVEADGGAVVARRDGPLDIADAVLVQFPAGGQGDREVGAARGVGGDEFGEAGERDDVQPGWPLQSSPTRVSAVLSPRPRTGRRRRP